MKRILVQSPAFIRSARRILKKEPHLANDVRMTLELLSEDAFHPQLRTHKLKGKLEPSWACRAGYNLRIIFEFVNMKAMMPFCWRQSERMMRCIDLFSDNHGR